ncbi:luciferin sulfotransferase-like [Lutzomyia longipalpis]|uniref:luciferin sulfotransferase-like n=1 Tax=Lutzomyia longipalpis TaxID=7200 RepID=UPI0024840993|nr:luciferin sulfotransferase-like [Lutzomyia longipalpis]
MSIICETFQGDSEKASYAGVEEFVMAKNSSLEDIPQTANWSKDVSYFLPIFYYDIADRILNFEVRPDDVWVITFPKCGTTWAQEMVWQICNNIDFEKPKEESLYIRFPYLEVGCIMSRKVPMPDVISILNEKGSPRFIKSHLPAPLLPKQLWTVRPKIIYVSRNPKDAAISFYHHYRNIQHSRVSLQDFLELYISGHIIYGPYHDHVFDFWRMRHEKNILFLTFEDMKKDNPSVIEKTARFFGKSFNRDQILELADYLSFSKFSQNRSINKEDTINKLQNIFQRKKPDDDFRFIRKGEVGSYKKEMSKDMIEAFDKWSYNEVEKAHLSSEIHSILFQN